MTLEITHLYDPRLIPRYLLEQIKPRTFDIDQWYKQMIQLKKDGDISNIYMAMLDDTYQIKGAAWCVIEPMEKVLFINFLTIDRQYQGNGAIMESFVPFIARIMDGLGLEKAEWRSTRPHAYEKYGFHQSKNVLLEMSLQEWKNEQLKIQVRSD